MKRSGFLKRILGVAAGVAIAPSVLKAEPEKHVFNLTLLQRRKEEIEKAQNAFTILSKSTNIMGRSVELEVQSRAKLAAGTMMMFENGEVALVIYSDRRNDGVWEVTVKPTQSSLRALRLVVAGARPGSTMMIFSNAFAKG